MFKLAIAVQKFKKLTLPARQEPFIRRGPTASLHALMLAEQRGAFMNFGHISNKAVMTAASSRRGVTDHGHRRIRRCAA